MLGSKVEGWDPTIEVKRNKTLFCQTQVSYWANTLSLREDNRLHSDCQVKYNSYSWFSFNYFSTHFEVFLDSTLLALFLYGFRQNNPFAVDQKCQENSHSISYRSFHYNNFLDIHVSGFFLCPSSFCRNFTFSAPCPNTIFITVNSPTLFYL